MSDTNSEWFWDLQLKKAVPADDRGPADHLLGPYPTKSAAEHWKDTVEKRNEAWEESDEEWNNGRRDDGDSGSDS